MSRNQYRVTHYVGDDCPGGHSELAYGYSGVDECACGHYRALHRLVADLYGRCLVADCPCPAYRKEH